MNVYFLFNDKLLLLFRCHNGWKCKMIINKMTRQY